MIVSFTQAIRIIEESGGSLSRQALYNWKAENPLPSFFVEINGKLKIDFNNSEWKRRVENPGHNKKRKSISDGMVSGDAENYSQIDNISRMKYLKGGRYFRGALRQAVLQRDNYRCVLCGKSASDGVLLEVDHIKEYEDGGQTTLENGQTLCPDCNKGKHSLKNKTQNNEPEYISQLEFGKRMGISRDVVTRLLDQNIIEKNITTGKINHTSESVKYNNYSFPEIPVTPEILDLEERARIAALNDTIYAAKIKEEKSKQEEIKTSELKKDLAPTYLIKHFFTFAENMIQLVYTRPHEIMPEIKALILAGHDKQAEEKFIRELEGIVVQCQKDLVVAIKDEGYRP